MDSNYITNDNSLSLYTQKPTDSYELDFNKIKTVEDCVLLIKTMLCGFGIGRSIIFANKLPRGMAVAQVDNSCVHLAHYLVVVNP